MASSCPQWNPYSVLDIDKSRTICYGWAPSKNRKCHNPIAISNRQRAERLLSTMSILHPSTQLSWENVLEELAHLLLCRRNHQDQAAGVVRQWKKDIEHHLEKGEAEKQEDAAVEAEISRLIAIRECRRGAARGESSATATHILGPLIGPSSAWTPTMTSPSVIHSWNPSNVGPRRPRLSYSSSANPATPQLPVPTWSTFRSQEAERPRSQVFEPQLEVDTQTAVSAQAPLPTPRASPVPVMQFGNMTRGDGNAAFTMSVTLDGERSRTLPARRVSSVSSDTSDPRESHGGDRGSTSASEGRRSDASPSEVPPPQTPSSVEELLFHSSLSEVSPSAITSSEAPPSETSSLETSSPEATSSEDSPSEPPTSVATPSEAPSFEASSPEPTSTEPPSSQAQSPQASPSESPSQASPPEVFIPQSPPSQASSPEASLPQATPSQVPPETPSPPSPAPSPSDPSPIPNSSNSEPQPPPSTTTTTDQRTLSGDCSICYDNLLDGTSLVCCKAQCRQYFHAVCITLWLHEGVAGRRRCPFW
ncbi:MAG: hypothetical protein Q9195_005549 [Heterodermia aff. obscurata]